MKYKFKDLYSLPYSDTYAIIITGKNDVFNNIVIDKFRELCKGALENTKLDSELEREFIYNITDDAKVNYIDFNRFLDVVKIPAVTGKWFCSVDYKMLTKKQRDLLARYLRNPSEYGTLCVTIHDYMDYKPFLINKGIVNHKNTHLITLQFPNISMLYSIVSDMIKSRGVEVPNKAIELFVMRMGRSYDEYEQVLDKICEARKGTFMTYADFVSAMKGIENYEIDDLIEHLLKPIGQNKIVGNRKIYKMAESVTSDIGARQTVYRLKQKISDLIQLRILINEGVIPITVNFSVPEVKGRLDENDRLNKVNDYSFKRMAILASQTSLRDLVYIQLMLNNIESTWDDREYERVLYSIIHRNTYSARHLASNLGINKVLDDSLYRLNLLPYNNN